MRKRTETMVVHRGRYYFVILRQYRKLLGFTIWKDKWRETPYRFLSKEEAGRLATNIRPWLKGKYHPQSARTV